MIRQAEDELPYRHYLRLLDGGTKPNSAKLTVARQIARNSRGTLLDNGEAEPHPQD